ncbi:Inner membrane protein [Caenorhabditis elegans]|uniref:Inner membrane protein n=1 Tax=Caenorhabditis elegans TaxID=6239 RepID=E7EM28_CAEEL|nr:Inner membrane protein [Caenorhabditis elegans]pir/G89467/ protein R09H3.2 [imported] - Caenorhabditis elegans [Caenorhabditis elegans]CCD66897.1 Inner membrane protein [Caenorhabditis elegans]|eukprot:NP_001256987.1 Uncharacterized protein CELE_R09H3.2 [Caenorhabditis elegans]
MAKFQPRAETPQEITIEEAQKRDQPEIIAPIQRSRMQIP